MNEALRVVPRDDLQQVRRWDMPAMHPRAGAGGPGPTLAELEAISEQARQDGHAQGLAEGREAAHAELQRQARQVHALCDALARPLRQVDDAIERQLAELAMLVARRVLEAELRLQPECLLGIVRRALTALPAATASVEIMVHPQTAALLRDGLAEAADRGWRIVEDKHLQPGACHIATSDCRIDAGVATRLAALVDAALDDDALAKPAAPAPGP